MRPQKPKYLKTYVPPVHDKAPVRRETELEKFYRQMDQAKNRPTVREVEK